MLTKLPGVSFSDVKFEHPSNLGTSFDVKGERYGSVDGRVVRNNSGNYSYISNDGCRSSIDALQARRLANLKYTIY